jgi:hypothetical protein
VHTYTLLQIFLRVAIFAITFTPAAPCFPIIIVLVPVRLKIMTKYWNKETLKRVPPHPLLFLEYEVDRTFGVDVDAWACKPDDKLYPEDEEVDEDREHND